MLTKAYKEILSIDEESDLQEFCAFFNFTQLGSPKNENPLKSPDKDRIDLTSTLRRFHSAPNFNTSATKTDSLSKREIEKNNEYDESSDEGEDYPSKEIKSER